MQTIQTRTSSLVVLLAVGALCLLGAAGRTLAQQTLQGCIDQWRAHSLDCCNLDLELRESCLDAARDGLVACLKNLPPDQKPSNRWNLLRSFQNAQCKGANAPCSTPLGHKKCGEAGRALYRWCIGLDPDISLGNATPEWAEHPVTVQIGNAFQLAVTTNDLAVQQVRFWVFRVDAPAAAADADFELGIAAATPLGGNRVAWTLTTDTGDWPLEQGEQRVIIVARSEAFTSPTATQVLDISTLIEVEIEW